jgi:hypothetical protein
MFDKEIKNISSDWIENPKYEPKDSKENKVPYWPFEVFLRLPVYAGRQAKDVYQDKGQGPYLARYPDDRIANVFVAVGLLPTDGKTKDKDGKPLPSVWTAEAFREHVRGALIDFYRKENKGEPAFNAYEKRLLAEIARPPIGERAAGLPDITYESISLKDFKRPDEGTSYFELYFNQQGNQQVAIVYQFPESRRADQATRDAVEWSLKSLDLNPSTSAAKRDALNRRKQARR